MTWSILGRDDEGRFGVAIASRFLAVGALCVYTRRGVGALSTQALLNPLYGPDGLALLAEGLAPDAAVARLVEPDPGRAERQVHLLGADGPAGAHTGAECVPWCGHRAGAGYSIAGNMLAGPEVIEATAAAYEAAADQPLAERLLAALLAGDAAGGDKRGKQAAALRVHAGEDYPSLDLRVDDHAEPVIELRRLYDLSLERYQPFVEALAGRDDPAGVIDRREFEHRISAFRAAHALGQHST